MSSSDLLTSRAGTEAVKKPKLDRIAVHEAAAFFEQKMVELSSVNEACVGIVLELSHKYQKHRRFSKRATPSSFWKRNRAATMENLLHHEADRDFFAAKMCEFGVILELAANLVDEISHKFLKQRRVLKNKAASRDLFWQRNASHVMVDYKKASKQVEVTMDIAKLGEAGEMLGIETAEPLKDVRTILISHDEYESLVDLRKLGIVKEITVKA